MKRTVVLLFAAVLALGVATPAFAKTHKHHKKHHARHHAKVHHKTAPAATAAPAE
jgi:hypothetical protein